MSGTRTVNTWLTKWRGKMRLNSRGFVERWDQPLQEWFVSTDLSEVFGAEMLRLAARVEELEAEKGCVMVSDGDAVRILGPLNAAVESLEVSRAEIKRLREGLEDYGVHLPRCPCKDGDEFDICDCGLAEALKGDE